MSVGLGLAEGYDVYALIQGKGHRRLLLIVVGCFDIDNMTWLVVHGRILILLLRYYCFK